MPFFGRHEAAVEPVPEPEPTPAPKRHGLFGSRRDPSPTGTARTSTTSNSSLHSYNTANGVSRHPTDASSGRRSLLHRSFGHGNVELDPSIVHARERVMNAEAAEREADRALIEARRMVAEARAEVKRLEEEAREEARRAKIKQYHAREVSKRGKALGRHGDI